MIFAKKITTILLILSLGISAQLMSTRHSRTRKTDRLEERKRTIATNDAKLSTILNKQTKNMTFQEAQQAKEYYVGKKETEMIIKCSQRLVALGGDKDHAQAQENIRTARLDLAQLFLETQNYKEAERYAQEYQKHYPGSDEAKLALYTAIRANFLARLSTDRDQEKTRVALQLSKDFLAKYPTDTEYTSEIKEIMRQCYQALIRNEINIIESQLQTHSITKSDAALNAAAKRLASLKEQYLPHVRASQKRINEIEQRITLATKKPAAPAAAQPQEAHVSKSDQAVVAPAPVETPAVAPAVVTVPVTNLPVAAATPAAPATTAIQAPEQQPSSKKTWMESVRGYFTEDNDAYFA